MSGESSVAERQLNATPLIDVMLVLLVIVIITLPVATHAVKLNVPQGTDAAPQLAMAQRANVTGLGLAPVADRGF